MTIWNVIDSVFGPTVKLKPSELPLYVLNWNSKDVCSLFTTTHSGCVLDFVSSPSKLPLTSLSPLIVMRPRNVTRCALPLTLADVLRINQVPLSSHTPKPVVFPTWRSL